MITEKQIIQILKDHEFRATLKEGDYIRGVYKGHFARIARKIVKNINYDSVLGAFCPRCGSRKESEKDELCMYCIRSKGVLTLTLV